MSDVEDGWGRESLFHVELKNRSTFGLDPRLSKNHESFVCNV
jgi:hypothetical protein